MSEIFLAKFTGDLADTHRLPAYEATQTLYGISRSLLITTNYLSEGRVRRKEFRPIGFEINIIANQPGSFETVFQILCTPELMNLYSDLAKGVAGNFLSDFIKTVFRRSVGQTGERSINDLEEQGKLPPGDMDALVDAIEPAMRESHRSVNYGASQILIINGSNNIVTFNSKTKDYVNDFEEDNRIKAKLFSVGSFNANSGYGRAFDFEEGRTIPFQLIRGADRFTIDNILKSFSQYTKKRQLGDEIVSSVAFEYYTINHKDGRTRKIMLRKVRPNISDL